MKKLVVLFAVVCLLSISVYSEGQSESDEGQTSWPERTIQIVCPFGAGGDTDYNARLLASYLSKELNKNVVVVNTTGAGGSIGAQKVADSKADGYTIFFGHSSALMMNFVTGAASYTMDDFEIACMPGMKPGDMVTVLGGRGFNSYGDLVQYTKDHPGELTIGISPGAGTHAQVLNMKEEGLDATPVEQGSGPERMASLLGGHLDIIISQMGVIKDYVTAGDLVNLGTMVSERNILIPEIPTLVEQGYDVASDCYFVCLFPKGTDEKIIEKFNTLAEKIVTSNAEYQDKLKSMYSQAPFFAGAEESAAILNELDGEFSELKKYF